MGSFPRTINIFSLVAFVGLVFSPHIFAGEYLQLKTGRVKINSSLGGSKNLADSMREVLGLAPVYRYYVVQFKNPPSVQQIRALTSLGAKVVNFLPEDSLIVDVQNNNILSQLKSNAEVSGVAPYLPEWKISPKLQEMNSLVGSVQITVRVLSASETDAVSAAMQSLGSDVTKVSDKTIYAQMPIAKISNLSSIEGVEWVDLFYPRKTLDFNIESINANVVPRGNYTDLTGYESGTKILELDAAWNQGYTGKGQIVAIGDTGLDTGNLKTLSADFSNLFKAFAIGRPSQWDDYNGHGTHVVGSVGGTGAVSKGILKGGANQAKLIMQSLLDSNGGLNIVSITNMLTQAYAQGARIHTNSWGTTDTSYSSDSIEFDDFMWKHPDMLVLIAAGNEGADYAGKGKVAGNSVGAPGTAKNVLTVGASENIVPQLGMQKQLGQFAPSRWPVAPLFTDSMSDNANGLAGFSSRGPTDDGRRKPDVVAPN